MQNVIISRFEIKSKAYQVFTMLKIDSQSLSCKISQAMLVKHKDGDFKVMDTFNMGSTSTTPGRVARSGCSKDSWRTAKGLSGRGDRVPD